MPHMQYNGTRVGGALVPYIGPNGNWFVGKSDTGISANFSGDIYTPVKGIDYFTEEEITELLNRADSTIIMKTIISNIGNMEELSDESAESLVEAINNYAEALRQLQLQFISNNNYIVNNHMNVDNIHMPTYFSIDELDNSLDGPIVWNQLKSSYLIAELSDESTEDIETFDLESEDTENTDTSAVYATDQDNTYVTLTNISEYSDDDLSSVQDGETIATLSSKTL